MNSLSMLKPPTQSHLSLAMDVDQLWERCFKVRSFSETLCAPLEVEDYVVQSMPDVSPTKWHLAHTSWFFETFFLKDAVNDYQSRHPQFNYLFNSYYNAAGDRHCRPKRGLLSRPTVSEIFEYRHYVDDHLKRFFENASLTEMEQWLPMLEIGLHHEQQHQELMLTDIKHVFSVNPLNPVYDQRQSINSEAAPPLQTIDMPEGIHEIGHEGEGFCYDHEKPRHTVLLHGGAMANRLITNGEFMEFIQDGGYQRYDLWLSEGWDFVQAQQLEAPFYWRLHDGIWHEFTLNGERPVNPAEPVCHVSFFEADAFARWAGARLPLEEEWEVMAANVDHEGNFVENASYHPAVLQRPDSEHGLHQMLGDVWEWTASAYAAYPGYKPETGALGEYNGKWMCNQYVLRGGSCATSQSHIRPTYRNFFHTSDRWQYTGIRLCFDD